MHGDRLAGLDDRAGALDERLHDQVGRRLTLGHRDGRGAVRGQDDRRQAGGRGDGGAFGPAQRHGGGGDVHDHEEGVRLGDAVLLVRTEAVGRCDGDQHAHPDLLAGQRVGEELGRSAHGDRGGLAVVGVVDLGGVGAVEQRVVERDGGLGGDLLAVAFGEDDAVGLGHAERLVELELRLLALRPGDGDVLQLRVGDGLAGGHRGLGRRGRLVLAAGGEEGGGGRQGQDESENDGARWGSLRSGEGGEHAR